MSIETRSKDLVRWLLARGVGAEKFTSELHHAAKNGDIEKTKFLSESAINLDKRIYREDGCTAIGEDKDCKIKDYFWTALHLSIRSGKIETVKTLLDLGAKLVNEEPEARLKLAQESPLHLLLMLTKASRRLYESDLLSRHGS